jgi:thiosulfate dehydrogenase [quinone] large subunit
MHKTKIPDYSGFQLISLVILRVFTGWHFLYEGLSKLVNPDWSSVGYLLDSQGAFSELFISLASSPSLLRVIDFLNIWGLIFIGLGLILGILTRYAIAGGIILLVFYYLSHPPLVGFKFSAPSEGSYLWVNKNLIEIAALWVLYMFPSSKIIGLDRFIWKIRN